MCFENYHLKFPQLISRDCIRLCLHITHYLYFLMNKFHGVLTSYLFRIVSPTVAIEIMGFNSMFF